MRFVLGNKISKPDLFIDDCVVCGIHFYVAKVAYDLYVPNGFDEDSSGNRTPTYTLMTNVDSVNVDIPKKLKL